MYSEAPATAADCWVFVALGVFVPLFALPLLYHIFVEDLPALNNAAEPVSFAAGMQEMSVLCIMLALLCLSLAMNKKTPQLEDADLPKIKDPVVIPPQPAETAEAAPETDAKPGKGRKNA